jgi:hypothetical protein
LLKLFLKNILDILPKILLPSQVSGRISGIRPLPDIRPDIQYPAFGLAEYPAKTVSGASLIFEHG